MLVQRSASERMRSRQRAEGRAKAREVCTDSSIYVYSFVENPLTKMGGHGEPPHSIYLTDLTQPVDPNPPAPRTVSSRSVAHAASGVMICSMINWQILLPAGRLIVSSPVL